MKPLVGAFNQEKALVGALSVIVKTDCGTIGSFPSTNPHLPGIAGPLLRAGPGLVPQQRQGLRQLEAGQGLVGDAGSVLCSRVS